ncbi:MAG: shikimate kinase [Treponema sp.]|jgi:shikimate kinase|nr:shikimate kinase [Treponema sp.]
MDKIILLGPKHCGKTSVGRAIAREIKERFVDTDNLIAENAGKSPRELYREGVGVFKTAEVRSLKQALEHDAVIVATGGGLVDNSEAVALLRAARRARLVYLDVKAEAAWERISGGGELPPFLNTATPQETHRALHERRAAAYRRLADQTVTADLKTVEEIVHHILLDYPKYYQK